MAENNNLLNRLWNAFFPPTPPAAAPEGRQRSRTYLVGTDDTYLGRNYDLEIEEMPVRDPERARKLIELVEYCPEVNLAINTLDESFFSSATGDDQGFRIGKYINNDPDPNELIPIDPEVKKILDRLIAEVVGGLTLAVVPEELCTYGDSFGNIGIDWKARQIRSVMMLPCWELFRVEDDNGLLRQFEQRRYLTDGEAIIFHPLAIIHWRHKRKRLYGRPYWNKGIFGAWDNLKNAAFDLARARRAVGANPNKHIMPCGYDIDYKLDYKRDYEEAMKTGQVLDFYLDNGADIAKVANNDPNLSSLIDGVIQARKEVAVQTGFPNWMFWLEGTGAKDIAGQPAMKTARHINRIRMPFAEGLKEIFDLELALHGIPRDKWRYLIEFPKIETDPYHQSAEQIQQAQNRQNSQNENAPPA